MTRSSSMRSSMRALFLDALDQLDCGNRRDAVQPRSKLMLILLVSSDADACAVARMAMARAFELRNQASSLILITLPPELLVECFSWLNDCNIHLAAVTETSRRFRAIALSAPSLWTHITWEDFFTCDWLMEGISMMLERSMHVSFRLNWAVVEWGGEAEEVEVTTLLARHMYRAETISITWLEDMGPLLSAPAPVLRELAVYSIPGRIVVPQSDWAPQLHRLKLNGSFEVPAVNKPFRFLTYFSGWMEVQVLSDARRLFQLCPQLKSLSLPIITKASLLFLPVGPVPASLLSLELHSQRGQAEDCDISSFVSMWHGRHMVTFVLDCQKSLIILAQHLLGRNLPPRLLELTGRTARLVADNNIEYSVRIPEYAALDSHYWAALGPCLRTLTHLVTTNFLGLLLASPTLASLQTIECTASWLAGETIPGPRMRAPQLRTLRITTTVLGQSILSNWASGIPKILLAHLEIDGQHNKIPEFVILGETVEYVRSIDWTNLKNCARTIYVGQELIWEERGVS